MKNIAKLTSYGCYLDCDFATARYPGDETHIVGNVAEYVYDLEKKLSDLEAKLAESEEQLKEELIREKGLERALSACNRQNDEFAGMIKKLVNEKDQLKQQLAESETRIEELESQFAYECECNKQFVECQNENEMLKQQLAEKEKEIETLKKCGDTEHFYGLLEDKRKENKILIKAIEQASQDKISFALEQLEKVKELLLENLYDIYSKPSEIWDKYGDLYDVVVEGAVNGTIDNQIKAIKEME